MVHNWCLGGVEGSRPAEAPSKPADRCPSCRSWRCEGSTGMVLAAVAGRGNTPPPPATAPFASLPSRTPLNLSITEGDFERERAIHRFRPMHASSPSFGQRGEDGASSPVASRRRRRCVLVQATRLASV
ncbi:unnamed protein product [Urochloa humidicola]